MKLFRQCMIGALLIFCMGSLTACGNKNDSATENTKMTTESMTSTTEARTEKMSETMMNGTENSTNDNTIDGTNEGVVGKMGTDIKEGMENLGDDLTGNTNHTETMTSEMNR